MVPEDKGLMLKDIFWLARKSIASRRIRSRFTVLAMIIGVGFLFVLISTGYGLERLVISQITSLHSLNTADIFPRDSRINKINKETIKNFKNISGTESVEPLISLIGRGEFRQSSFDVVIFGATNNYFKFSDIEPMYGRIYESNEIDISSLDNTQTQHNNSESEILHSADKGKKMVFNIEEGGWVKVREKPSLEGKVIGYSKKQDNPIIGEEVLGANYLIDIEKYAKAMVGEKYSNAWIYAKLPLWKRNSDGSFVPILENGIQREIFGYIGENFIEIQDIKKENLALLSKENIIDNQGDQKDYFNKMIKFVVVNEATLKAMNIENPKNVLGQKINIIFKPSEATEEVKIENLEIVGIISGIDSHQVYIPIIDLRLVGIEDFSQAKVIVKNKKDLSSVREKIENMGFQTESTADTVERVNNLFRLFNLVLLIIGSVALIIAALGMFNTLVVSLLERTREIGIMKAIGMKKNEVIFLIFLEAGTMGFWGGALGCVGGFLFCQLINFLVNIFLVVPSKRFIFIVSTPWYLPLIFIFFTLFISILKAIIPARRAANISPLSAIRYE